VNPAAVAQSRHLLLALDASRCCPEDVVLAVELAALLGGELEGLFVEDADLMTVAQLPFAREVGGRSGQDRPMLRESVESLVRRRVERVAGELERAAKMRNVPVRHTTTRGKVVQQAFAQREHRDVLLLHPRTLASSLGQRAVPRPILVWYEGGNDATATLDVAVALARMTRTDLLVGVPAGRLGTERDIRASLSDWIDRLSGRVRIQPVFGAPTEAIIDVARSARAAQIVLTATGDVITADAVERMLAAIGSRLVLVR
jgi:hypothetical protein